MTIRHVVLVSAVLSVGSFVYMVGFAPMNEAVYGRAGAINQTPGRLALIATIRRSLAQGQLSTADRMVEVLKKHNPEDTSTLYYRALVDRMMGREDAALSSWQDFEEHMSTLTSWPRRYSEMELDYYRAWCKAGIGEIELSEGMFRAIADRLELQVANGDGVVMSSGALYNLACYRAMSGEISVALGHWERAVELGYGLDGGWWAVDPDLEPLHDESRFWEIGSGMGRGERNGDALGGVEDE